MITINTAELIDILSWTPDSQNIMLVGRHGIGKSEILTHHYQNLGCRIVTLFLGQMSDPGDLIGLPTKDEKTGHTVFMPPYWFPTDGQPVVLFLDELNRARPEVLQTIMDLALNRRLAGRELPAGSRLITAVNDGEEYQLTDLDPALVSRFNVYNFEPTSQEWLLWAENNDLDIRVTSFIAEQPVWLDGEDCIERRLDNGLDKTPDRRAWKKLSDIIKPFELIGEKQAKLVAGIVGVAATSRFMAHVSQMNTVTGRDVLLDLDRVAPLMANYKVHQFAQVTESVFRYLETSTLTDDEKAHAATNLALYQSLISSGQHKEALAHMATTLNSGLYPTAFSFILTEAYAVYEKLQDYINSL